MLPVYDISISYEGIKKMSQNVAGILDMVFDSSENLSLVWVYSYLFPHYLIEEDLEQCKKWLRELRGMAEDDFSRDGLKPIYEYILFQLLNDHIHYLRESGQEVDISYDQFADDEEIPEEYYVNCLDCYLDYMFRDWDFLDVANFLTDGAEANSFACLPGVNLDEYIELMPADIRKKYLENKAEEEKRRQAFPNVLLKVLTNVIRQMEDMPALYENNDEPSLNDYIAQMLSQVLAEKGFAVMREKPQGFAFKKTGAADFYICNLNETSNALIGESKDAKLFGKTIRQLLGYMNRNTEHGFTISINKTNTVGDVRSQIVRTVFDLGKNSPFSIREVLDCDEYILSVHKMPEDEEKSIYLYHFILNLNTKCRREIAQEARENKRKIAKISRKASVSKQSKIKTNINDIIDYWEARVHEGSLSIDWAEANTYCWRCGCKRHLERTYIVPERLGGKDEPANLVLLCEACQAESPNVADPEFMWDWLKAYKAQLYETFWLDRGFEVYERIYKKSVYQEIREIVERAGLVYDEKVLEDVEKRVKEIFSQAQYRSGDAGFNPPTIAGYFRICIKKIAQDYGVEL